MKENLIHMSSDELIAILGKMARLIGKWEGDLAALRSLRGSLSRLWDSPAVEDYEASLGHVLSRMEEELEALEANHRRAQEEFETWRQMDAALEEAGGGGPVDLAAWKMADYARLAEEETPLGFSKLVGGTLDAQTAALQTACAYGETEACLRLTEAWRTTGDLGAFAWNDRPTSQWYPPPVLPVATRRPPPPVDPIVALEREALAASEEAAQGFDPHHPDAAATWDAVKRMNFKNEELRAVADHACAQGDIEKCIRAAQAWENAALMEGGNWGSAMETALPTYAPSRPPDYWAVSVSAEDGIEMIVDRCGEAYVCGSKGRGLVPVEGYVAEGTFFERNLSCAALKERLSGVDVSLNAGMFFGATVVFPPGSLLPGAVQEGLYTPQLSLDVGACVPAGHIGVNPAGEGN